ncbi:MAG: glycoside hydrolase family 1 protein [Patescibacteria group bacterium]
MDQINEEIISFPHGFLWGTATAAHQVEGDNVHSDWWSWERSAQKLEALRQEGKNADDYISGHACDHYHRFEEDINLIKLGGQNAHRLSLEWSRVEPEEGVWDEKEIEHYREVLEMLKQRGIKTFVTLWHFTNPQWFAEKGGWLKRRNVKYFVRYCERVARILGDLVDVWTTINEPNVYAQVAYNWGVWPPQHRSYLESLKVFWHLARAHRRSYAILHRLTPHVPAGAAINVVSYVAHTPHRFSSHVSVWLMHMATGHLFYTLTGRNTHDYIGMNYYFRTRLKNLSWSLNPSFVDVRSHGRETSSLGWEIYPQGLFESLVDLSRYHKPIYILENGIATDDDGQRARFILSHLREVYHAIREEVDVRGYFHWSLLDNFEWHEGWRPKFGLVAVDRETFKRTPKESFYLYKRIAEDNAINPKLSRYARSGVAR